jgi:endonuclease-3
MNVQTAKIIARLTEEYSTPRTTLQFTSPLELLIATILSAQCTDERVNRVTPLLFQKYKTPEDYAHTDLTVLERIIRPTGYYRRKAKLIQDCCQKLVSDFKSRVPQTLEELLTLPGVARKTANIVLSNAFGIVVGIAVDTHVKRLSQRLGFTKNKNPDKIEKDLMTIIPRHTWRAITYLLIEHGRNVCKARRPLCENCVLGKTLCPSYNLGS